MFNSFENEYLNVIRRCDWHSSRMECIEEELGYYNSAWIVSNGLSDREHHAKRVLTKFQNVYGGSCLPE